LSGYRGWPRTFGLSWAPFGTVAAFRRKSPSSRARRARAFRAASTSQRSISIRALLCAAQFPLTRFCALHISSPERRMSPRDARLPRLMTSSPQLSFEHD
jgi:hypothetical protein